jgi:ribonucleoside-diphosphate reductase beta chain
MQTTYTVGARTFVLDQAKAEAALAAKRVVGGRETMTFNLLPLRYRWAYDLYRTMKANHWEPEDVPMQRDVEQWRSADALSEIDRWIVRMGIGYFSAAEGIVGDNIIHVVRELVTASELKLVLGRHAHEESIHADSLLYMISSLGIDPHECDAMFDGIPTIVAKNAFVTEGLAGPAAGPRHGRPRRPAAARAQRVRVRRGTPWRGVRGVPVRLRLSSRG